MTGGRIVKTPPDLLGNPSGETFVELDSGMKVKLSAMRAEVRRELRARDRLYPWLVGKGKLSPEAALSQKERMRAVLVMLEGIDND